MAAAPLVSIITPAYNAAAHIAATAQSVLGQTFGDWEWIVADDGSTDATREIVTGLRDDRITLLEGEHSGLPAVARNRAIARARGAYVAFLDADDLWLPEKLALQLDCFARHPEVGLVFTKVRYFFEEIGRLGTRAEPSMQGMPNPGMLLDVLVGRNRIVASSAVVRRPLLDRYGVMDEDPLQRGTEDYELWLRLAAHAPFAWIDRPLVHYRIGPGSVSGNAENIARGTILAVEKLRRRESSAVRLSERELEAWRHFQIGHAQFRDGANGCGRRELWRSLRLGNRAAWRWFVLSFLGSGVTRRLRRLAMRFQ